LKPRILLQIAMLLGCAVPLRAQQPLPPIEFHGLVQVWFTGGDGHSTFRIRRTELKAGGPITDRIRWGVQIDPSRLVTLVTRRDSTALVGVDVGNGSVLQDALLTYSVSRAWAIDVGQYKLPLSREGTTSSAALETVERTLFATAEGKFADIRDIGVRLRGVIGPLELHGGVFNGLGESFNRTDANMQKAFMARAVLTPLTGLALGASGGHTIGVSGATQHRLGADVSFVRPRMTLRSELLSGSDGAIDRIGYYGLAAYRPHPKFEAVVRYDDWDAGTAPREQDYVGGVSYLIDARYTKLQLNFVRKTFAGDATSSQNLLMINAQAAW
jgi:hypothetical protein